MRVNGRQPISVQSSFEVNMKRGVCTLSPGAVSMNSWQPLIQYLHVLWQSVISAAEAQVLQPEEDILSPLARWSGWASGLRCYDELQKLFSVTRIFKSNTTVEVAVVWVLVIIEVFLMASGVIMHHPTVNIWTKRINIHLMTSNVQFKGNSSFKDCFQKGKWPFINTLGILIMLSTIAISWPLLFKTEL